MTHPITSTSEVTDVTVAYDRVTDALAAARQLAMPPGALEEAAALIVGAFDDDIRFRVPIAYARSATAGIATWTSELRLRNDRLKTALDTLCAAVTAQLLPPPSHHRQHRPRTGSMKHAKRTERVFSDKAVAVLGPVQQLAARGELAGAGAAKLGRRWTFDLEKLRRFVRQKERETWHNAKHRPDASGGPAPSTAGLRYADGISDGRFTRVTRRLRGRATKRAASD